jgi:MFS family permease
MCLIALGLVLLAFAPLNGDLWLNIMPAMIALGFGCGMAFNPVLLAGTAFIPENESGLASGVLNTAFMMGGSLGLAVLASIAAWYTSVVAAHGGGEVVALLAGYHVAFWIGALAALLAALLAFFFVQVRKASAN